jgi:hypothetical protein
VEYGFYRIAVLAAVVVLTACGTTTVTPATTLEQATMVSYLAVPKRILLLMPDEFSAYSFTSPSGSTTYKFGSRAAELLPQVLSKAFSEVTSHPVSGEGALLVAMDQKNRELPKYDYVAYPKFVDTKITRRGRSILSEAAVGIAAESIETTIRIEFVATDRSRSISILGHGKGPGNTDAQPQETPQSQALRTAFRNLLGNITTKRDEFQ